MNNLRRIGISPKSTVCLQDLLNLAHRNPDLKRGGAIVTFTGIVRGFTHNGKKVDKLQIEACKSEAIKALSEISKDLRGRHGVIDVLIHHLVGEFNIGDDLVYVVVIGETRKEAFEALEEAVERYKKNAEIWKKEFLKDGTSYWTA